MVPELSLSPGPLPSPAAGQSWIYPQGGTFAVCSRDGATFRIDLPDRAAFSFDVDSPRVLAHAAHGMTYTRLRALFDHDVLPMVLQARGLEVLHASAVRFPQGVAAFCADSGVGKTTLAAAFHHAGSEMIADDALALEVSSGGVIARPVPFSARLRPETAARFGMIRPSPGEAAPLAALVLLQRSDRLEIRPLQPLDALPELLRHAYCFSLEEPASRERLMRRYLDLAMRAPAFRLLFRPGFDNLPATIALLRNYLRADVSTGSSPSALHSM